MYVLHLPFTLGVPLLHQWISENSLASCVAIVLGTGAALAAMLSWRFVEMPFLRLKDRFSYRAESAVTVGTGSAVMSRLAALWLRFEALDAWAASLLIFAAGMASRTVLMAATHSYLKVARYEMERTAISLAHQGVLGNPYSIPTGPSAHVPPGYALILAAIFWAFGTGLKGELVKQFCSSAVSSVQYALLPVASPALGIGRRAGLAAGVFGALLPLKYSTEVLGDWEAPWAALALLLLLYATASAWRDGRFTARRGFLQGLGWGAAFLITPGLMPVFAVLLAAGLWKTWGRPSFFAAWRGADATRRSSPPLPYLRYAAASAAAAALCLVPWTVRNETELGAPIFSRSNFGLEIHLSNNGLAGPLEPENYDRGVYNAFHPLQNVKEAEALRDMGEVAYNRDRLRQGERWIGAHPGRFAKLTAERAFFTWFPWTKVHWRDPILWALTLGCAAGLALLWRRERDCALLLAACLLSYTPLYYLIHVNVRHRYPVDWIVLVTAFYFAVAALERFRSPKSQSAAAQYARAEVKRAIRS